MESCSRNVGVNSMCEAIIAAVIICWFAAVVLFICSLFISLRFLFRFQKIASNDSADSVRKNVVQERNSMRLMPWSIVITHCCGLPCAMLSYMLLQSIRDFGLQSSYLLLINSVFVPSCVIVIGLILVDLFTMLFCAFKVCK